MFHSFELDSCPLRLQAPQRATELSLMLMDRGSTTRNVAAAGKPLYYFTTEWSIRPFGTTYGPPSASSSTQFGMTGEDTAVHQLQKNPISKPTTLRRSFVIAKYPKPLSWPVHMAATLLLPLRCVIPRK